MMMTQPIIHHPFNFSIGPIPLTGFGIAMMAAFGLAHWVSQPLVAITLLLPPHSTIAPPNSLRRKP